MVNADSLNLPSNKKRHLGQLVIGFLFLILVGNISHIHVIALLPDGGIIDLTEKKTLTT